MSPPPAQSAWAVGTRERGALGMPEGDTIFRSATMLSRALLGKTITRAEAPSPKRLGRWSINRLNGTTVESVEPRGKHLLMRFSNGLALHTHMQMAGTWHIYRPGERWRVPGHLARVILRTEDFEAVCFSAPTIELLVSQDEQQKASLVQLGPDVLAPEFDSEEALRRLELLAEEQIAVALLNQRALAGIGNVYKSEVLFVCRQSPFTPVDQLSDEGLRQLIAQSRRLLRTNVATTRRVTTGVERQSHELWVYGRARLPCRRCETTIRVQRQHSRATYWCPRCQPEM